jgi:hypothetical protein
VFTVGYYYLSLSGAQMKFEVTYDGVVKDTSQVFNFPDITG